MPHPDHIINLTPHEVVVIDGSTLAVLQRYPSAGEARVKVLRHAYGLVTVGVSPGGSPVLVPVYRTTFGALVDLPEPRVGTAYIVSRIAAEVARAEGRSTADLLIPDDVLRGPDGQGVGCRAFAVL